MTFRILLLVFFLVEGLTSFAQTTPDLKTTALGRREFHRSDTLCVFFVRKPDDPIRVLTDRWYFWYKPDSVFSTAGGYDGWLLNGEYKEFYPEKSLKESGIFQDGLKSGEWKSWYVDGRLKSLTYWRKGLQTGTASLYQPDGSVEHIRYSKGKPVDNGKKETDAD